MISAEIREKLWTAADSYYPKHDYAHGRSHIERVVQTAREIGSQEGANLEVIELAAMLHDLLVYKETHSKLEGFRHELAGAEEASRILEQLGFHTTTIDGVTQCIRTHRKRSNEEPKSLEAKCLFDADKLDCLGAIGVIRCAFVSFDHGQEFYKEIQDIEAYKRENIRPDGTIIDFSKHSSNLEWELSIKRVPDRMYTATGKRLARERADFMQAFYERFRRELKGIL